MVSMPKDFESCETDNISSLSFKKKQPGAAALGRWESSLIGHPMIRAAYPKKGRFTGYVCSSVSLV
jgi:hypothetical protein